MGDAWEVTKQGVTEPLRNGTFIRKAAVALLDAAGINDATWRGTWEPLTEWIDAGIDFDQTILPAVKAVASRPGYKPPRSLRYFDQAVREQRTIQ